MLNIAISGYGRMGKLYKEIIQNNSLCNLECIFTNKIENDKNPMYKPLELKNKLIEKNKCLICMFSNKISLRADKGSIKFINKCFL